MLRMIARFIGVSLFVMFLNTAVAVTFKGDNYNIYIGDVNSDGIQDIYLKVPDTFILLHGDIVVPLLISSTAPSYVISSVDVSRPYYTDPVIDETINIGSLSLLSSHYSLVDINSDGVAELRITSPLLLHDIAIHGVSSHLVSLPTTTSSSHLAYTYDALGRLTFVSDSVNGNRDYDYDAAGNRCAVTVGQTADAASDCSPDPDRQPPAKPDGLSLSGPFSQAGLGFTARWRSVATATEYRLNLSGGSTITVISSASTIEHSTNARPLSVQAVNAFGTSSSANF